jgi:NADH-quinone oxidoreductase subunit C
VTHEQAKTLIGERFGGAQVEPASATVGSQQRPDETVLAGGSPERTARRAGHGAHGDAAASDWRPFASFAKDTLGCRFFSFSSAVDWKEQGLEVIAKVDNVDTGLAILMKTKLGPGVSECQSLVPVYRGANWMERECYDMFGIRFRRPSRPAPHPAG